MSSITNSDYKLATWLWYVIQEFVKCGMQLSIEKYLGILRIYKEVLC